MQAIGILVAIVLSVIGLVWGAGMEGVIAKPGTEIVLIDRPILFGHEGVRPETVKPEDGRVYVWNSTDSSNEITTTPQSISIAFSDLTSSDNILLDFESTVQYRVTSPITLVTKFGNKWFENNVRAQYSTLVRNAVKERNMSDMMSSAVVAQQVDDKVSAELKDLVKRNNIPVEIISISLGRAKPNEKVLGQMNETAAQQQRFKTLAAATAAEGQREQEQKAKAKADQAYLNEMKMTPEQYIQLQSINQFADACRDAKACILSNGQVQNTLPAN